MQHLDEGTIHAWLDGALGAERSRDVEAHVAACAACAALVAEARGLIAASSRILSSLDHVPAHVVPAEPAVAAAVPASAPAGGPRVRWGHRYGRLAAVVAFIAVGTLVLAREANRRDAPRSESAPEPPRAAAADTVARAKVAPVAVPAPSPALSRASAPVSASTLAKRRRDVPARPAPAAAPAAPPPTALGGLARREAPKVTVESEAGTPGGAAMRLRAAAPLVSAQSAATTRPRLVASDTALRGRAVVRRDTYELASGARVVLEATPPATAATDSLDAPALAPATIAERDAASNAAVDSARPVIRVIRWRGPDGTGYALWGPLPTDELERIRIALGKGG